MKIDIELPRNRWNVGRLVLRDGKGAELFSCECKGKADNRRAAAAGNPDRDPIRPYGDTPSGAYAPTRLTRLPDGDRLGRMWFPLEGADGDALQARVRGGRTGLGIHAGRGEQLMATYGCVRLRESDMETLAVEVGDAVVEVTVTDAD